MAKELPPSDIMVYELYDAITTILKDYDDNDQRDDIRERLVTIAEYLGQVYRGHPLVRVSEESSMRVVQMAGVREDRKVLHPGC
jgi:hypothetical protein